MDRTKLDFTETERIKFKDHSLYILVACEESQAECAAFRALGHFAFSCDIQPCRRGGNAAWHIQSDVTALMAGKTSFVTQDGISKKVPRWDLIIAHPPCTYLCKVSSVLMRKDANFWTFVNGVWECVNEERYKKMIEARKFFRKCLDARAQYVAVENPCPMAIAQLPKADFYACPSWYGDKYTKKTYYWVKNLPPLFAEYINTNTKCLVRSSRGKYRSRTSPYLAAAIARQWTEYILSNKKSLMLYD